jgi:molecular chaperone HtpG
VLKEGIAQDQANQAALLPLLRFASTAQADNTPSVSLADYLARIQPGQERIYYVIAESLEAARAHPAIERLKERGLEVLLLSERIDEWVMAQLETYEGKRFKDAARGDLDLGPLANEADRARHDAELKESKGLLKRIKDALGERVTEVRISDRLKDSPALLVLGEHDLGDRLRRILSAAGQKVPEAKPLLEVNVNHALVRYLDGLADAGEFSELAQLLYEQAQLAEGATLANPPDFVLRLNRLLVRLAAAKGQSS